MIEVAPERMFSVVAVIFGIGIVIAIGYAIYNLWN